MIKLLAFLPLLFLLSCKSTKPELLQSKLTTAQGHTVTIYLALTLTEQEQGLSGVQEQDFKDNEGMLFYYKTAGEKHFWMPDTYFNLDLFFLDHNFKVLDIIRNLPHYKGRNNPELIPRARGVWAQHVLEMKASSQISQGIKIGDQLKVEFSSKAEEAIKKL
ncbi:MAG: DUF192 domain-containing protein [Candidatus Caldatribacteriota bacterium]